MGAVIYTSPCFLWGDGKQDYHNLEDYSTGASRREEGGGPGQGGRDSTYPAQIPDVPTIFAPLPWKGKTRGLFARPLVDETRLCRCSLGFDEQSEAAAARSGLKHDARPCKKRDAGEQGKRNKCGREPALFRSDQLLRHSNGFATSLKSGD
ncbi:hypothetical protein VTI74DRAFT_1565 [Chaetomium olivicolor]